MPFLFALETMSNIDVEAPRDWLPLYQWTKWHKLNLRQQAFIDAIRDHFEIVFQGGNGTGKSHILQWIDIALCLGIHPHQYVIGPPPIRMKTLVTDFEHGLDKIIYETLFLPEYNLPDGSVIGPMCPKSAIEKPDNPWSKEDRTLYFKNGSLISFMTSEQKKRLHSGTTFDILNCDEEPGKAQYDESKRGLRKARGGGRIFHAFTPPYEEGQGPSWSKEELLDAFEAGDPDIIVIKASIRDNPAITEDFIKKFSKGKTAAQLKVQLDGEYPTWGKMIHGPFQDRTWNPAKVEGHLLPLDWEVPYWEEGDYKFEMAVDWHQSKPCAAIWSCEDADGNVYVYDELTPEVAREKTIDQLAEIFMQMEGQPQRDIRITRWGDPKMKDKSHGIIRGFNAWQEFRNCGIRFAEGYNRQPGVGVSVVNDFLRGNTKDHPRLFIKEDCVNVRRALRNHYWVQRADGTGTPDPKWSDYPICIRYIIQGKSRKAKNRMRRKAKKWPLTSVDVTGDRRYGPYTGIYMR